MIFQSTNMTLFLEIVMDSTKTYHRDATDRVECLIINETMDIIGNK